LFPDPSYSKASGIYLTITHICSEMGNQKPTDEKKKDHDLQNTKQKNNKLKHGGEVRCSGGLAYSN
jgi:hypothetical protein